jgi:rod shape-determining protein MreD
MKKKMILFLFTFLCFLLQSTVFRNITFGGVGPNLLIVVVASFGFMLGKKTGLILGFMSGIWIDIFFGSYLGFYALIYMLVGYWNGFFRRAFYPEDIKLPIILILVSDFILEFFTYLFSFLLRGKIETGYYFTHVFVPSILYTMIIAFVLYPIILFLNRYFEKVHRRSARKFGMETEE